MYTKWMRAFALMVVIVGTAILAHADTGVPIPVLIYAARDITPNSYQVTPVTINDSGDVLLDATPSHSDKRVTCLFTKGHLTKVKHPDNISIWGLTNKDDLFGLLQKTNGTDGPTFPVLLSQGHVIRLSPKGYTGDCTASGLGGLLVGSSQSSSSAAPKQKADSINGIGSPTIWHPGAAPEFLPTLSDGEGFQALSTSAGGSIILGIGFKDGSQRPMYWHLVNKVWKADWITPASGFTGEAVGVSPSTGLIVGHAPDPTSKIGQVPVYWKGQVANELPAISAKATAVAATDSGMIVGEDGKQPVIWLRIKGDYTGIVPTVNLKPGWIFDHVCGINARGQILITALKGDQVHAFILESAMTAKS